MQKSGNHDRLCLMSRKGPQQATHRPAEVTDSECLGEYPSLAAFAREAVAPLLRAEGLSLLDCLDLGRVLRVLRGDDRLRLDRGRVYLDRQRRGRPTHEPDPSRRPGRSPR